MACYNPLVAYRGRHANPATGKFGLVFNAREASDPDSAVKLPCGRCIGCRLERSRQWAMRCVHEASLHESNCFLTLTYAPEYVPKGGTLVKRDFQLFMKRLRKRYGGGIRFFHCGEYGDRGQRPHYHACIFGLDFGDKYHWRTTQQGFKVWRSPELDGLEAYEKWGGKRRERAGLWDVGMAEIGEVTFESAAYVARYITKKITGPDAADHYASVDPRTGEVFERLPEYTTMSRRPGIGRGYFEKWYKDIYPRDAVVMRGIPMRPPKFYDAAFELAFPFEFDDVKESRGKKQVASAKENEYERLRVRERHQYLRLEQLKRGYEDEV